MKKVLLIIFQLYIVNIAFAQSLPSLIPFRIKENWGYVDSNFKILIPVKYNKANLIQESTTKIVLETNTTEDTYEFNNNKFVLVNSKKKHSKNITKSDNSLYDDEPPNLINAERNDTVLIDSRLDGTSNGYVYAKICSTGKSKYLLKFEDSIIYDNYDLMYFLENYVFLKKGSTQYYVGDYKGKIFYSFLSRNDIPKNRSLNYFSIISWEEEGNILQFRSGDYLFPKNKYVMLKVIIDKHYIKNYESYSEETGLFEVYNDINGKTFLGFVSLSGKEYWKN